MFEVDDNDLYWPENSEMQALQARSAKQGGYFWPAGQWVLVSPTGKPVKQTQNN